MIVFEKVLYDKIFRLVNRSIIDEPVDAIVNPANTSLSHGGGVAGLISRSGGPAIQTESTGKAPVETGHAVFTTAGILPFRYIIHTVGPVWKGGKQGEADLLRSAVNSALQLAGSLKLSSISMPAISTGIFGYPLSGAMDVIATAVFLFMSRPTPLREIRLCEFSADKADEMKSLITKMDLSGYGP